MKPRRALLFTFSVVLALCAACGWWLHQERRQYALNRQLVDALDRADYKTALSLVNAGADPNTRAQPAPAPSFKLLFNQLLHHTPPPVNISATALIHTCGFGWNATNGDTYWLESVDEHLPLLQAMLAHGADVNARTVENMTALHIASYLGRWNTEELLLQHGAKVDARDDGKKTCLMLAVDRNHVDTAHILLAHGANPNAQNVMGNTALQWAIGGPDETRIISELLAHGADPNIKNKNGVTPLMQARQEKRPDLVRLLKQHGAK